MKSSSAPSPTLWSQIPVERLRGIRGVAFDIDDTFSSEGLLSSESYSALWALKRAGFVLVPITGRPAGWCDHFARFWPIDAIIGEDGAFAFFMDSGIRKRLDAPGGDPKRAEKMERLRETILREFPSARFASDQAYRENDLAIDFCEDVPPWKSEEVDRLVELCKREGAHAKVSSIHVNTWYGDFDKRKGFQAWLDAGAPGIGRSFPPTFKIASTASPAVPALEEWIFAGDSPNDEPLFGYFPNSVGVANLSRFIDRLKTPPTYLTDRPSGEGFCQMAEKLLLSRK